MELPLCPGDEGFWHDGRVSTCVSRDVLGSLVPSAAAVVSLTVLSIWLSLIWKRSYPESRHDTHNYGLDIQLPATDGNVTTHEPDEEEEEDYLISWLFTGEDSPRASSRCNSHTDYESQSEAVINDAVGGSRSVNNAAYELPQAVTTLSPAASIIEAIVILASALAHVVLFVLFPSRSRENTFTLPLAQILTAIYMLALLASRVWSNTVRIRSALQTHSFILYSIQWVCSLVSAHSSLLQDDGRLRAVLALLFLATFTILLALHATAPRQLTENLDETTNGILEPAPEDTSSLISLLTLSWVTSYVAKGRRSSLEQPDLNRLGRDQRMSQLAAAFTQTSSPSAGLVKRLVLFLKGDILVQGFWAVSMSILLFAPVGFLRSILAYLDKPEHIHNSTIWALALGIFISKLLTGLAATQCDWAGARLGARLKGVLLSEVMAKSLRRSSPRPLPKTRGTTREHKRADSAYVKSFLDLVKVDADVVSTLGSHVHVLWLSAPVQVFAASYALFNIVGISGLAGVACSFIMLQFYPQLLEKQTAAEQRNSHIGGVRSTTMAEFVSGIRIIKYYAWEASFQSRVSSLREAEVANLRVRMFWWSLSMTAGYSVPLVATTVTLFLHCFVAKQRLTAATFFPTLTALATLRAPLDRLSDIAGFVPSAKASMLRITEYLMEPDVFESPSPRRFDTIGFQGASFKWTGSSTQLPQETDSLLMSPRPEFRLTDVNISFAIGKFNAIVGHRGAGKSSLLLALMGEMELVAGRVCLTVDKESTRSLAARYPFCPSDSVAYCAQTPWIQNDTLRANITFGLSFDSWRYKSVLEAVALMHDLPQLQNGDLTIAGENGCCLSVSQRHRLALARALYSTAKVILIDDLLTTLDNSTAKHVLLKAIKGPLMYNRTCIMATCQARMAVPFCDFAVRLDHGKVSAQGTPQELVAAGAVSRNLLTDVTEIFASVAPLPDIPYESTFLSKNLSRVPTDKPKDAAVTPYEVDKLTGTASWTALIFYIRAMGPLYCVLAAICAFATQQALMLVLNLWATAWVASDYVPIVARPGFHVGVYAAIVAVYILVCRLSDMAAYSRVLAASWSIHERLISRIFHAKFGFFEETPTAEIAKRFTGDVDTMDGDLAPSIVSALHLSSNLVMSLGVISAVFPFFLPLAAFICLAYVA